jgi:hypothetical protein
MSGAVPRDLLRHVEVSEQLAGICDAGTEDNLEVKPVRSCYLYAQPCGDHKLYRIRVDFDLDRVCADSILNWIGLGKITSNMKPLALDQPALKMMPFTF